VCSSQWPLYDALRETFELTETRLLGITTDNTPTQFAWNRAMGGVWFPILSDFYPHGQVAKTYGTLRSDGTSERALFLIDKKGVIRYIDVQNINEQPELEPLLEALGKLAPPTAE
jgi:peroxiredoxin (alkyl hydroperoxide reductase subunit C)